jgi:hypothetical protein
MTFDLNTDYAESDVMLGERAGTGTNSNGSNNNSSEDRNSNYNSAPIVAPDISFHYSTVCTFENFYFTSQNLLNLVLMHS